MDTLYLLFYLEVWDIASKDRDLFINEQIRAKEVMVIGPNGEQLGIKNIKDALTLATYADFDLVDVHANTFNLPEYNSHTIIFIVSEPISILVYICLT